MTPTRVKVWGLIRVRKRPYLILQTLGLLFLAAAFVLSLRTSRFQPVYGEPLPPFVKAVNAFLDLLPWFLLLGIAYEILETWLVLKKFKRLETSIAAD